MQHTNTKTIEKCHRRFRDAIEDKVTSIIQTMDKNIEIEEVDTVFSPDELMLQAFQTEEQWESKDKLGPSMKFMFEGYEIILDVLRQNSKLLEFYNETAMNYMNFCKQNNRKSEFKKITDVLSRHLKIIINQTDDDIKKIPNPVLISDVRSIEKVAELRIKALEISLEIDNWSDADKIIRDIKLIEKTNRTSQFYDSMALLFKKARFYLFYAASLCSADQRYKYWKKRDDKHRQEYADKIIISYLMIPLANPWSNFKPINFNILNSSISSKQKEFSKYAKLINQNVDLSRETIKEYIESKNLKMIASDLTRRFYEAMEAESTKPSETGKLAKEILKCIDQNEELSEFKNNIIKRVLQQLSKVFKVIKYSNFKRYFDFIDFYDCERAVAEGNRDGIFRIKIDPTIQKLTFDYYKPNEFVTQKIKEFTKDMKAINSMIKRENKLKSDDLNSIFAKAKENLPSEIKNVDIRLESNQGNTNFTPISVFSFYLMSINFTFRNT